MGFPLGGIFSDGVVLLVGGWGELVVGGQWPVVSRDQRSEIRD
jgi:hypothetical protein